MTTQSRLPPLELLGRAFAMTFLVAMPLTADDDISNSDVAQLINAANQKLRLGQVAGALSDYEHAAKTNASNTLDFNRAVAMFRSDEVDAAQQLFDSVAVSSSGSLAAKSFYNSGNCDFAMALQSAQSNRSHAIERLRSAITHYRKALELDPNDDDARANIELAVRRLRQLMKHEEEKEEAQQQQQQQQQQDQDQQQGDPSEGEQNAASPSSESPSDDDDPAGDSQEPPSSDEQQDAKSGDEQQPDDQSNEAGQTNSQNANETQQAAGQQDSERSQNDLNRSESSEQPTDPATSDDASSDGREATSAEPDDENPSTPPPEGELKSVNESSDDSREDQKSQSMVRPAKDGHLTPAEARKMLQAIRDRELRRRIRKRAIERHRPTPVDRDW